MCPEEKDKILVGESKLSETPKKPQYPVTKTKFVYDDAGNSQHEINKKLWEAFQNQIVTSGTTTIGSDGYWYVDGVKTNIKAIGVPGRDGKDGKDGAAGADGVDGKDGKDGRNADIWTIGADDFWYVNGRKTIFKSRGEDGKSPLLRISTDGQSLEISSDGGQTWLPFEKNFNKLRVLGYVSSVQLLPRNANIGDIYGVWNPDVYSGRVDEEGHLIQGAYDLYVNTVRDWVDNYHITKVYDYDTELPSSAANGTTVLVPVDYLTLDKTKIDGYKVYRFSLDRNGWVLILDTAEIYASKDDIINYGDNVYALVQGEEEHTYELYRRDVGWVYFGTNASITYVLVQDIDEGTETNILSGKAVTDAYGHYIENPEFVRAYLDGEDKVLWGIKTDGTIYFGAGVPPQVKEYIEERIGNYDDITTFLDDLEEGDETLRELLNKKVDKEEGKSLIDEEYAEGVHYIENPEFAEVKLDQNDRILEAIMPDGTKLLPAGYEIGGNIVKTVSNPEYLDAKLDATNKVLEGIKINGNKYFAVPVSNDAAEVSSQYNPEFIDVKLDAKGKIVEGVKNNGTKYIDSLEINGTTYYDINNPEFIQVLLDSNNKILEAIKHDNSRIINGNVEIFGNLKVKGDIHADANKGDILKLHPKEIIQPILSTYKYWTNEFEPSSDDLKRRQTNFNLLWFSDLHSYWYALERIVRFYNAYSDYIDEVLSSGDANHTFHDNFEPWSGSGASSFLNIIGNHDCFSSARTDGNKTIPAWTVPGFSQKECYDKYFKPYLSSTNINIQENKCYFYKDYPSFGIRIICLSCYHWKENIKYTDDTQIEHYPDGEPVDTGQQQIWFRGVLEDARTSGLHVICSSHGNAAYTPENTPFDALMPYNYTGNDGLINVEMFQEVQDFIDAGGNFIAWLNGHTHIDRFGTITAFPDQLQISVGMAGGAKLQSPGSRFERSGWFDRLTKGTINDDLFDIVSINVTNGSISLYRIGCEYDKYGRHIKSLSYDYRNKRIL